MNLICKWYEDIFTSKNKTTLADQGGRVQYAF